MKKISFGVFAFLTLGMGMSSVSAQTPAQGNNPAPANTTRPIVVVNIAKVLKEYNRANQEGLKITQRRQQYVDMVKPKRDRLAQLSKELQAASNESLRVKLREEALALNREIEDIDRKAQEELSKMSDQVIVEVYQQIKGIITAIAQANNLQMVLCYPDASDAKSEMSAAVAQLKLQTPALIPFYVKDGLDITKYVVETLNTKYPAPPVPEGALKSNGGSPVSPAPMGSGTRQP